MSKIRFGLIGSGWRAEFYIRIAKQLPELFELCGVLIRDKQKGRRFAERFQVRVVNGLQEMKSLEPDFIVLSIRRGVVSEYLPRLYQMELPVLCETPPGENEQALTELWEQTERLKGRIQVAEQYLFQPLYGAWKQAVDMGLLGNVQNINISALHGYHGVSMIRHMLGISFEDCDIYGKRYYFDVTETYGREGLRFDGEITSCSRDRVTLEFTNGKIAFFDFSDPAQYHSFIRTRQLSLQGDRGEIDDLTIRYLSESNVPVTAQLHRIDLGVYGNQEWSHLGIMLGEEFLYKSPFLKARLNDDEIAVAACLVKMAEYVQSGKEFYPLREALQDMYIAIKMEQAMMQPYQKVTTRQMIWTEE